MFGDSFIEQLALPWQVLSASFERDNLEQQLEGLQAELAGVQAAKEELRRQADVLEADKAALAQQVKGCSTQSHSQTNKSKGP